MLNIVKKLWKEEEGQGLAEYAFILLLVAVVCAVALKLLGESISEKLADVEQGLDSDDI
jgi:pilus assembly protein Flp/PilA